MNQLFIDSQTNIYSNRPQGVKPSSRKYQVANKFSGVLMLCAQFGPIDGCCFDTHSHCQQTLANLVITTFHDDIIKWKHFPRYCPFVRGIHWSPENSPHKGQWHGALKFSLICAWINGWVNNREAGDLKCHHTHYDVTIIAFWLERNRHSPCFTKENQLCMTWLYYYFDLVISILLLSKVLYMLIKILGLLNHWN